MTNERSHGSAFKSDAVANEFLSISSAQGQISPMKLQKLAYFAHGWYLAFTGYPLVDEPVQAWTYGPVIHSLYREFKEFRGRPIDRLAHDVQVTPDGKIDTCTPRLQDQPGFDLAAAIVARIWAVYGSYTAVQLSTLTHQPGTPWRQIMDRFGGNVPRGISIPNELIRDYFKAQMSNSG